MLSFIDKSAYYFDIRACLQRGESIWLTCPQCQQLAKLYKRDNSFYVSCDNCAWVKSYQSRCVYDTYSQGVCNHCGRYFNVPIAAENACFNKFNVNCLHCYQSVQGQVKVNATYWSYRQQAKREGCDPFFNLPFYLCIELAPKQPIWALNPQHLTYLQAYIAADLRKKPNEGMCRSASHSLPVYLKAGKNRERVLTKLKQLQAKVL